MDLLDVKKPWIIFYLEGWSTDILLVALCNSYSLFRKSSTPHDLFMAKRPRGESSGWNLKISSGTEANTVVVRKAGQRKTAVSSQLAGKAMWRTAAWQTAPILLHKVGRSQLPPLVRRWKIDRQEERNIDERRYTSESRQIRLEHSTYPVDLINLKHTSVLV